VGQGTSLKLLLDILETASQVVAFSWGKVMTNFSSFACSVGHEFRVHPILVSASRKTMFCIPSSLWSVFICYQGGMLLKLKQLESSLVTYIQPEVGTVKTRPRPCPSFSCHSKVHLILPHGKLNKGAGVFQVFYQLKVFMSNEVTSIAQKKKRGDFPPSYNGRTRIILGA
jgi:hypothetical protein